MIKQNLLLSLLLFSILLWSCASPSEAPEETSETTESVDDSYEMPSESSFKFDLIIANNIAAPVKLLTDINKTGLNNYQEDVTNPVENAKSYATSEEKAIGFGIYGADLSYKSLYQRNAEMADYLITIRKLSEELGLNSLFDQASLEKFDRIKSDPDSVKFFIFDKYDEADSYLRSNDRLTTAALIITGGLIESLHLVSSQMESGDATKEAYTIFLEQKTTMKNLLGLYESLEAEGNPISIKEDIQSLYNLFNDVNSIEKFSKENIKKLHVAVDEVRNKLV